MGKIPNFSQNFQKFSIFRLHAHNLAACILNLVWTSTIIIRNLDYLNKLSKLVFAYKYS